MRAFLLTGALTSALLVGAASKPAHAEKYALLVGVSVMQNSPRDKWLSGPHNDLPEMRGVLKDIYGFKAENILSLEKLQSSRAGIEQAFREHLINKAKPGDFVMFYYSGHGTQIPDRNGDEGDGKDEALVPYDAGGTIESYITDDNLADWVGRLKTKNAFIMLDSCHSGTGLRGGSVPRAIDAEDLGIKARDFKIPAGAENARADDLAPDGAVPVLLTGCRSDQTSSDSPFLLPNDEAKIKEFLDQIKTKGKYCGDQKYNPYMGALTFSWLCAVVDKPDASYADIHKDLSLWLQKQKFEQAPQLEGAGLKRTSLEGSTVAALTASMNALLAATPTTPPKPPVTTPVTTPAVPVTPTTPPVTQPVPIAQPVAPAAAPFANAVANVTSVVGDTAQIQVSAGIELTVGSIFENASGGALRVLTANGTTGSARIVKGTFTAGDKLRESFHFVASKKLRVTLLGDSPAKGELNKRLGALDFVQVVDAVAPHEAELEFSKRGNGVTLNVYRNQQQLPAVSGADVDEVFPKIGRVLENLYTVNQLTAMENPKAAFRVDLQVNGRDFDTIKVNDTVSFTARAERDCYLYLVDVDPVGKVTVLFPNKYAGNNKLRAGETTSLPAPNLYRLRVAGPAGGEAIKAIVTESPLRLEVLEAAGGEIAALQGEGSSVATALLAQLKRELNGGVRGIEVLPADPRDQPITTDGWATDIVLLTIKD